MSRKGDRFHLTAGILGLISLVAYPLLVQASSLTPLQVVRSGSDRGLHLIKSTLFEGGPNLQHCRDELLRLAEECLDFQEMSKRALGRPWREISPEKQREFVQLFKQIILNTYVSRIEASATPTMSMLYRGETLQDRFSLVKTQVTGTGQSDIEIDYSLMLSGTDWKVYDVDIEGISLVSNYRQQFSSILNGESFESLLKRLKEKVEKQPAL